MKYGRRESLHRIAATTLLASLVLLVACGRKPNAPEFGAVTIALISTSPSFPNLQPGSNALFTATVYDQNNQGVTWTMNPLNFGTLTGQTSTNQSSSFQTVATVTYTAPSNVSAKTSVTITATSISNPSVSTSLSFSVIPIDVTLLVLNNIGQSIPASTQAIGQGQQLLLVGEVVNPTGGPSSGVSWSLSPPNVGSLVSPTTQEITYVAPIGISGPTSVSITATSLIDSSATASVNITIFPSGGGFNVAPVTVNGGPVPGQVYANGLFTSVTLCNPGSYGAASPTCQTINGVLVDTGSYGLRVLQSQIPLLKLPTFTDGNGNTLENCTSLVDGSYLWGPVSQADIYIGGEFAGGVPTQVISSSTAPGAVLGVPDGCSNGGTAANTPQLLGANAILGIGPEPTDCTVSGTNYCDGSTQASPPNRYYSCFTATGCNSGDSPVTVSALDQISNPVVSFLAQAGPADAQGTIIQLPAVSGAEVNVTGQLIFGIGTQPNNALASGATVLTLDSNDHFTTVFDGQTLTSSFLDSGSSALFFPDSLPVCSVHSQFFCPASLENLSAVNQSANAQVQSLVNFNVDNADDLLANNPQSAAFSDLAGPEESFPTCSSGTSCSFDWGLPFFFGRSVYTAIDGQTVTSNGVTLNGPWFAY